MSTTVSTVHDRAPALSRVRWFFALAVFPLLIALGAQVRVPVPGSEVPFTLQTLFVFLAGGFLGAPAAFAATAVYLMLGCAQAPVFAGSITGFPYLLGPTGGYLLGFLISAPLIALLLRSVQSKSFASLASLLALGSLPILACGAFVYHFATGANLALTLTRAVIPFLAGDAVKVLAAATTLRCSRAR